MQWLSSRNWTRVAVFISYDDNNYTTFHTFILCQVFQSNKNNFTKFKKKCTIFLQSLLYLHLIKIYGHKYYIYDNLKERLQIVFKSINLLNTRVSKMFCNILVLVSLQLIYHVTEIVQVMVGTYHDLCCGWYTDVCCFTQCVIWEPYKWTHAFQVWIVP